MLCYRKVFDVCVVISKTSLRVIKLTKEINVTKK